MSKYTKFLIQPLLFSVGILLTIVSSLLWTDVVTEILFGTTCLVYLVMLTIGVPWMETV